LQGQELKRLREITGKRLGQLLKLTDFSQSLAYFFINLFELVEKYNKIMYSDLPHVFFKSIIEIYEKDSLSFEL